MRYVLLSIFIILVSSPSFSMQWQCQSAGGWTLDTQGRAIQSPGDPTDNFVIAFVPPNKMQIVQSTDPLDFEIYKFLNWVQQGNVFHGAGIFTMDGFTFNVAETLTDTSTTTTLIMSGHPEILAMMGRNTCKRIQ